MSARMFASSSCYWAHGVVSINSFSVVVREVVPIIHPRPYFAASGLLCEHAAVMRRLLLFLPRTLQGTIC